jgi:hypothetical protein
MSSVTVKRFVRKFLEGGRAHYSIHRRPDRLFQLYHDDPYLGINQPYQLDDQPISGLLADVQTAQAELLRLRPDLEALEAENGGS